MSKASEAKRAAARAAASGEAEEAGTVRAVALIADGGGFRLAVLDLPAELAAEYVAQPLSEPEVLPIQLGIATQVLGEYARGGDELDGSSRPVCGSCGSAALVRHPTKAVMLCAACDARTAVTA